MNNQDILDRFEELEAGRILGDLDSDEINEWETLSADPRCKEDLSLELMAAALEVEFLESHDTDLPEGFLERLQQGMANDVTPEPQEEVVIRPARWQAVLAAPKTGWAIAALFAILFIAQSFIEKAPLGPGKTVVTSPEKISLKENRDTLIFAAGDLINSEFGGKGEFNQMSGTVVWSDELQEGYMSFTNLPANDPGAKQYQLWIVDPARDEKPVDGGVFDISASDGTAIIPIRNPLVVNNPQAFVITLEQAGGVVVSKQEVVVAVAKPS
jgi:hypothetical protein